jgi:uncharacterized membrane protein YgcG
MFDEFTGSISSGLSSLADLNNTLTEIELQNAEGNEAKQEAIKKKSFERNKKIQIGLATISMLQGVINAMSAQSVIPEPFGTVLKAVNAGVVLATGIANIAKIKNQKYQGGGGGTPSRPSSGGGSAGAGSFNIDTASASTTDLNPDGTAKKSDEDPMRVYVVESDITERQNRAQEIDVRSTI